MTFLLVLLLSLIGAVTLIFTSYTLVYYYYSKKPLPHYTKKIHPTATLIIPFLNEALVLPKKIANTAKLHYPKNKLEVIFLDDHSTDASLDVIQKAMKNFPFKYKIISNPTKPGKPNALNYLLPKIKTEITVVTDSDSLVKEDALEHLMQEFQNKDVGATNAKLHIIEPGTSKATYKDESLYRTFYHLWRSGESALDSVSICNGPLMAFRTKLLKGVELSSSVDDTELIFTVIKKGYRFSYAPNAIVSEYTPTNFKERQKQKMRRARGVMYMYTKSIPMIGKRNFGKVVLPFALLTHVLSPYLVLLGVLTYLGLLITQPPYIFSLALFLVPKLGAFARMFISMQVTMALSPFLAKGWNTASSTREELSK